MSVPSEPTPPATTPEMPREPAADPTEVTPPSASKVTKKKAALGSAWVMAEFGSDQALRMVRSLLLTRLISKELFGLLGLTSIVIDLVANVSDVGINLSIIRQRRADERVFVNTAWTLSIVRGVAVWLVASLLAYPAALFYDEPRLALAVPLLAFSAILTGAWSTKISTTNRDLKLARVTIMKIACKALGLGATILWALNAPDHLGVILVGPLATAALILIASFVMLPGPNNFFAWDKQSLEELVRFGRWILLSTLMTFLLRKGDLLTIGKLEGTAALATYTVAYQVGEVTPRIYQLLNSRIVFPVYSAFKDQSRKALRRKVFKLRGALMLAFLPINWLLILFGSPLINLLYPDDYSDAGWMLELFVAGRCPRLITASMAGILLAKGDSFKFMLQKSIGGVLVLVCMAIGAWIGSGQTGDYGQIAGLLVGMGVGYLLTYPLTLWSIRGYDIWMPKLDIPFFVVTALVIVVRYTLMPW